MKIKGDVSVYSLLRKLRSGCQMFSHIEWFSAYASHMSVMSLLGIAGLFLAVRDGRIGNFKLLSGRSASLVKPCFIPGLRNLGNNCFLNVVLQSLASCSSFRRFLEEIEDVHLSSSWGRAEDLPLLVSLVTLFEELSTLQERCISLNPQKVMSAMQEYTPHFQLMNQQDAAEALLHLLSCLRDELSESYMPSCSSLADVAAPTSRFLSLKRIDHINDTGRWRQQYLGPFDGVLGSFLSCRSCSFEILMDFGFFHTLPLPLLSNTNGSMLDRLSLEDCIKRFLAPEHVENYSCSHCWHISAIKFLSSVEGHQVEEEIKKLSCCSEQDSCDCRNIPSLQTLPWSNRFSRTFKQLSIAHCPQILCLHLQRTSVNAFGEPVKLQGHISFPLILNLSPFVKHEVGIQKQTNLADQQRLTPVSYSGTTVMHSDPMEVKDDASQTSELGLMRNETCSDTKLLCLQTQNKVTKYLYRLVSVVEHFGRAGSGHYVVYRGVTTQMEEGDCVVGIDIPPLQWFCISDSEVHGATEDDVLGADATLLFYERF